MRTFCTYILIALLVACPALCQATEAPCCPGHETEACSDSPEPPAPGAPGEADFESCLCSGTALKADDSNARHVLPHPAALRPVSFESRLRPVLKVPSHGSLPANPDDWLGRVRLHALLAVFRC